MKYLRYLWSMYRPAFGVMIVRALQSSDYQVRPYLAWLKQTTDFSPTHKRSQLTGTGRLLLGALWLSMLLEIAAGILLIVMGAQGRVPGGIAFGSVLILLYPFAGAYGVTLPILFGRKAPIRKPL